MSNLANLAAIIFAGAAGHGNAECRKQWAVDSAKEILELSGEEKPVKTVLVKTAKKAKEPEAPTQ